MMMLVDLKECVTCFIYFLDLIWVRYNRTKFHHCKICVKDFREGGFFHPWAAPKRPILNRAKMYLFCTFISSNCVSGNFFFGEESSLFYSKDLTLTSFSLVKQHVHFFFSNYWSFAYFLDDFFNSSSFFGLLLIFIKLHICSLRFTKSIFDFVFQPGYFWRHYYSRIQPPWQYLQQTFPCDHWIGEVYLAS